MLTIRIVSSSRRDALRRALDAADVRVAGEDEPWTAAPTVVVADGVEGLESLSERMEEWPSSLVFLVDEPGQVPLEQLRRHDHDGWAVVPRDASPGQILAAVRAAAAGMIAVPAEWARLLGAGARSAGLRFRGGLPGDEDPGEDEPFHESLTGRELEVLASMARGLSNRDIGARLGISEHTAKFHVASVLAKLGAHNRAEAVRLGIRRGLVTL